MWTVHIERGREKEKERKMKKERDMKKEREREKERKRAQQMPRVFTLCEDGKGERKKGYVTRAGCEVGLVLRLYTHDKVAWDDLCSLVDQLVKGVLPVCSGLAPDNRPCAPLCEGAVGHAALSVTLHVCLLQVCRKPVEVLVVGEHCDRLASEKVVVPNACLRLCARAC